MRQGVLHSSRYSPGNMDRESLEAVFVGRDDVMEDVLSRVTASIRGPQKHYLLLVGPRGSGKTHLLALAYHRLMASFDADGDGETVAIAALKEEEWGVASYLDLTVRILRALAEDAPPLDAEIAQIHDRFCKDPVGAEAFAASVLRRHSEGKTLLLLCENLADLFRGLGDEGQKRWRAAIQADGNWAIVATTPRLFAALTLQDNPFYGFFTIRALEKIDLETGIELLAKKAAHEEKPDLAAFLRTPLGRARARAVHHLVDGNQRAYMVLFDFLDKESLEDLVGPLMRMADALTPYYQGKMRQIPPAQRKIIEFLCLEGSPVTVKDIATSCLMSQQTAAKQIGELVRVGFVSRNRSGRNTFCELSEPMMRICVEVKGNNTQHFGLFVEFLRHWFTSRELERRRGAYQHDVPHTVVDLEPDDQELWIERSRLCIDQGLFDEAIESAARVETLPGRSLVGRLLAAEAIAAGSPLGAALDAIGECVETEDFKGDEALHRDAIVAILTRSVRNFGARYLPEGLLKLRGLFASLLHEGVLGRILTELLLQDISRIAGSLEEWESALRRLASSLADLPDCKIPLGMLHAAVTFTKTGDERQLLRLPLEQRQLLEEVLPPMGSRNHAYG